MLMISLKKMQNMTLLCCCAAAVQAVSQTEEPPPSPVVTTPAPSAVTKVRLKVMAKGSGRILKRAEIRVGQEILATGPDGTLELDVPGREGSIQVLRQGYEAVFIDFKDLRGKSSYSVYLPPGKPDDSEVVITGQRRPETSRKTVTVQETSRIAPGGDPAQIAQLLPGVQSSPGRTEVVIRGSGPNDSRYFVDDILVPSIFHQVQNLSVVPAQQLTDVDFNSGGFGAQYGDATGGIIVLRSKDTLPENPRTEFVVNVPFYLGIYHERPLDETSSIAVSVRKSTIEAILPMVLPDDSDITVIPLFADAYARYLTKSETTNHKLTVIASEDGLTLSAPFDSSTEVDGKVDVSFKNRFAVIGWERDHNLGEGWRYRTTPQYAYSRFQIGFGEDKVYITSNEIQMPTEFTKRLDKGRNLYLGFSPQYTVGKFDITAPAFATDDPYYDPEDAPRISANSTFSFSSFAAWSSLDLQAGPIVYTPGVRVFKTGFVDEVGVDPRLAARYPIDANNTIKAATGQYSIAPEPQETNEDFGDPDIGYERANHYVLGLETRWTDRWITEFQTFYKKTYRLVVSGGPNNYQDTGSRRSYGFEAFIRRNLTEQFFGWLAYTWSVSEERKSDEDDWYTSQYDQTHILNLAGSYKISAYWDLGTRLKYNTQSPYTPVTGSIYNSNLDKYQPIYDNSNPNSARAPVSHSIALFATYDSLYDTYKLKYQFGVDYLSVGRRVDSVQYNYDYSEKEEMSSLPPIPYIQISGEF
ncbi:MAG TPA: TonB-dependent receptor plug domain-containing protein [Oligoflexus sp.]|uniref:TonB-dependent receptor plug domain-containing protein n=1 Tax=Oligoflexus sp. TaxID=1971216 RepID=UPI002D4BC9B3|nr:TonB-dependent receptor plug domain-containing protein [Oligoflexus sp.]HYX37980.1 TonB-dependent receptor plug domain-containing protein [Oligoflexus sp.]